MGLRVGYLERLGSAASMLAMRKEGAVWTPPPHALVGRLGDLPVGECVRAEDPTALEAAQLLATVEVLAQKEITLAARTSPQQRSSARPWATLSLMHRYPSPCRGAIATRHLSILEHLSECQGA